MKHNNRIIFAALAALVVASCGKKAEEPAPSVIEKDPTIEDAISARIALMTPEQKAGQMMQITIGELTDKKGVIDEAKLQNVIGKYKVGSILNVPGDAAVTKETMAEVVRKIQDKSMSEIGIPCLYGLDQIHGSTYFQAGTFFPHEINIAASFNVKYATEMGKAIAYETRAGMVPWVFAPTLDLFRNPAWPRGYESFGEDPYMQAKMGAAEVKAMQGSNPNKIDGKHVAVTLKHYLGYGNPVSGKDRTPAAIPAGELREKYFAPFKAAIEAGATSVMVNSSAINGVPVHANAELLTGWLKEGLHWDGMVVTDWEDVVFLTTRHHVAADRKEALAMAINAGIDMVMAPYDPTMVNDLVDVIASGAIPQERVDDAVARVLRLKYRLGLFDAPTWDIATVYPDFASEKFVAASKAAALESEVLLKNDGVLPIKQGTKILLCGPNANSIKTLNGGWSYTWQGSNDPKFVKQYNTIYEALGNKFGKENVTYVPGVKYTDKKSFEEDVVANYYTLELAADTTDVIIACIGENSYTEFMGNTNDLSLSANQRKMVDLLLQLDKPVILVLNEGRPRVLGPMTEKVNAIVDVLLPGNYGADALADLLAGDENFSGHLPYTYPKYVNSFFTYDYKVSSNHNECVNQQWAFGEGLSYTTFAYSYLKCNRSHFTSEDELKVTVVVSNTGAKEGKDAVILYSSDEYASQIVPDAKRVRGFYKVNLKPGEKKRITFRIPAKELAYVGADGKWILEKGDFTISVADQSIKVTCDETRVWECPNQNDPLPEEE